MYKVNVFKCIFGIYFQCNAFQIDKLRTIYYRERCLVFCQCNFRISVFFPFCCTTIPTDVSDRRAGLYGALQPVNFCLRGTLF